MKEWSNKRYWIVGASEGLGLALAKECPTLVSLVLTARNEKRLKEMLLSCKSGRGFTSRYH